MIRVLICDDQDVVREGLRAILGTVPEIEVTGAVGNGVEAVEWVEKDPPDVVLMDLNMPVMNGIQATRRICERFPAVRVLALTTYDADEWVFDAIRATAAPPAQASAGNDQKGKAHPGETRRCDPGPGCAGGRSLYRLARLGGGEDRRLPGESIEPAIGSGEALR